MNDCIILIYDMHGAKVLYILTGHSLYNRKHKPFILCGCRRGEGVTNETHDCKIISDDKQAFYWEKSERRWNRQRKINAAKNYSRGVHRNWADEFNEGITHFGLHYSLLPTSNIRFDVFHLRCAITRRLMSYLRFFILKNHEMW